MAGGKETPRQKMIGMMYLVLTALLALNISNEVLEGFVKVERSLLMTGKTLSEKASDARTAIDEKYFANPIAVDPFMEQASRIKNLSAKLQNYLQQMKAHCIAVAESNIENANQYYGTDDFGLDTCMFFGKRDPLTNKEVIQKKSENQELTTFLGLAEPTNPLPENPYKDKFKSPHQFTAIELREKLESYRDSLLATTFLDHRGQPRTLTPEIVDQLKERFTFEGGTIDQGKTDVEWEAASFYHVPLAATLPLLTKAINDVKSAEADVTNWLLSSIDAKSYKFTDLRPLVIPMTNMVMKGDSLRADILLAAFDPSKKADIYVESQKWTGVDDEYINVADNVVDIENAMKLEMDSIGTGKLKMSTKNLSYGDYTFRGVLEHTKPDGTPEKIKFITPRITISEPGLVVSPTAMNVFYRGLENPVEISVPGVPSENIKPTIDGGHTLKRTNDGWAVIPSKNKSKTRANISVVATMADGSEMRMPTKEFRIKDIPPPTTECGGATAFKPSISKAVIQSGPRVRAELLDFVFDIKPKVKSFTLSYYKNGTIVSISSNSSSFTPEMLSAVKRLKVGDKVFLEDITARMPDGEVVPISPLTMKIS